MNYCCSKFFNIYIYIYIYIYIFKNYYLKYSKKKSIKNLLTFVNPSLAIRSELEFFFFGRVGDDLSMRWPSCMIDTHGKGRHQLTIVVVEGGDIFAEPRTIERMEDGTRK